MQFRIFILLYISRYPNLQFPNCLQIFRLFFLFYQSHEVYGFVFPPLVKTYLIASLFRQLLYVGLVLLYLILSTLFPNSFPNLLSLFPNCYRLLPNHHMLPGFQPFLNSMRLDSIFCLLSRSFMFIASAILIRTYMHSMHLIFDIIRNEGRTRGKSCTWTR